jgi:hypothetical protein
VHLQGKSYRAHRIIWEILNSKIPEGSVVDHVNRNPFDNRIENLRLTTTAVNNRNQNKSINCKSGVTGVYKYISKGRTLWVARWSVNGKDQEKHFLVGNRRTDQEAFEEACNLRRKMLQILNESGANYTQNHGA